MGASSLGECLLDNARTSQEPDQSVVPLVTPRFVVNPIRLLVLLGHFYLHGPGSRPCRRIIDCDDVLECARVDACPPFDQMQVLARSLVLRLGTEITDIDDQRIPLPTAARVPPPLANVWGQVRTVGHGNDALPPLPLANIIKN